MIMRFRHIATTTTHVVFITGSRKWIFILFFFLLFLCYTQLAVSLTFTKSKADTFLNNVIYSLFIILFFLSFSFLSSLKNRDTGDRWMCTASVEKKEGAYFMFTYTKITTGTLYSMRIVVQGQL